VKKDQFDIITQEYREILEDFKREAMNTLQWNLAQNFKSNVSGKLKNSIHINIERGTDRWFLELSMNIAGPMLEKKAAFAYKASIKELAEWVRMRGLDQFKYIPGYSGRSSIPDDAAERVAWAIKRGVRRDVIARSSDPLLYSWLYRPYFSTWKGYKSQIVDTIFSTSSEELASTIRDMYQQTADHMTAA
jgi:hypothetical protein